jgi:hypothetical protein
MTMKLRVAPGGNECVALVPRRRQVGDVTVLPYREFLEALWAGEYR